MTFRSCLAVCGLLLSSPLSAAVIGASGSFGDNFAPGPGDEILIRNNSDAGILIEAVEIDLTPSTDVVFDPLQTVGQPGALFDVIGSSGFSGVFDYGDESFQPQPDPRTVFRTLTLRFTSFDAGDQVSLLIDADADSGQESFVSPDDLAGATISFTFSNGIETVADMADFIAAGPLATFNLSTDVEGFEPVLLEVPLLGNTGVALLASMLVYRRRHLRATPR